MSGPKRHHGEAVISGGLVYAGQEGARASTVAPFRPPRWRWAVRASGAMSFTIERFRVDGPMPPGTAAAFDSRAAAIDWFFAHGGAGAELYRIEPE